MFTIEFVNANTAIAAARERRDALKLALRHAQYCLPVSEPHVATLLATLTFHVELAEAECVRAREAYMKAAYTLAKGQP